MDPVLELALRHLDARLLEVCDEEEDRARALAGDAMPGWAGVRALLRPPVRELVPDPAPWTALIPPGGSSLRRLGTGFGLTECELEVVLVVVAAHVEPRYQAAYAVLQDDERRVTPTERLLQVVLGRDRARRDELVHGLGPGGSLVRSGILVRTPGSPLGSTFDLADDVVAALHGDTRLPVAVDQLWLRGTGERPATQETTVVVHGTGDRLERALQLVPHGRDVVAASADTTTGAVALWRVGVLTDALAVVDVSALDDPAPVVARLVGLTHDVGGRVAVLTREPVPTGAVHVEATPSTWAERRAAWVAATGISERDAGRLAARHRFGATQVRQVVERAASLGVDDLEDAAAASGVQSLRHSRRTAPALALDDLILRDTTREALDRLVYFVAHRDQAGDDLGLQDRFPVATGPVVLFAGRSGTGKTAAAEAVAAAVGRPLHTIDLAQLVSKYVGETEKHVDEVFTAAQRTSAVLFFDEADAVFTTRTEKADSPGEHFGNMLVGYLLQRIEHHDGLTILATNLRGGIDEAFLRRFQFRIEFPVPQDDERRQIWDVLIPLGVERADDVDLAGLAKAHRFTGGDIRNAALRAIFLAHRRGGPLQQADLERAVELELLEMGRLSRREVPDGRPADRGALLRSTLDALEDVLDGALRARFRNEIHVVHGAPTQENVAGRRPAVSVALFRLAARRGTAGLRAGFVVSAWSHRPEEESELLGVVHEVLTEAPLGMLGGRSARLRVAESNDFDLLNRFWSSHGQAVRPSVVLDVEID